MLLTHPGVPSPPPPPHADMFHSLHDKALLHATARAVSGEGSLLQGSASSHLWYVLPGCPAPACCATMLRSLPTLQVGPCTFPTAPAATTSSCCAASCCPTVQVCPAVTRWRAAPSLTHQ